MARHRGACGPARRQGDRPLDETVTLPAGTTVERTRPDGRSERLTLSADTVFPADCVWEDSVIINDWSWSIEALGWAEAGE